MLTSNIAFTNFVSFDIGSQHWTPLVRSVCSSSANFCSTTEWSAPFSPTAIRNVLRSRFFDPTGATTDTTLTQMLPLPLLTLFRGSKSSLHSIKSRSTYLVVFFANRVVWVFLICFAIRQWLIQWCPLLGE